MPRFSISSAWFPCSAIPSSVFERRMHIDPNDMLHIPQDIVGTPSDNDTGFALGQPPDHPRLKIEQVFVGGELPLIRRDQFTKKVDLSRRINYTGRKAGMQISAAGPFNVYPPGKVNLFLSGTPCPQVFSGPRTSPQTRWSLLKV